MIRLHLPYLPPSTNSAYANIRGTNKRVLTTEGKAFKTTTAVYLLQKYPTELSTLKVDKPFWLFIRLNMPDVINKGWPKTAKSKFKKVDATNRVKLLEDVLKDVSGIDDSQNIAVMVEKNMCPEESTDIVIYDHAPTVPLRDIFVV